MLDMLITHFRHVRHFTHVWKTQHGWTFHSQLWFQRTSIFPSFIIFYSFRHAGQVRQTRAKNEGFEYLTVSYDYSWSVFQGHETNQALDKLDILEMWDILDMCAKLNMVELFTVSYDCSWSFVKGLETRKLHYFLLC